MAALTNFLNICVCIDSYNILVRSDENRTANFFARLDTIAGICIAVSGMVRLVVGENSIPRCIEHNCISVL